MTDFNDIYIQYFKDVYKYAFSLSKNKHIAEEITQETFFKALKNIDGFSGKCKIRVWLCQIAKNTYYSYQKKEKKCTNNEILQEEPCGDNFELDLANKDAAFKIHKLIHNLKEPYKEVFSLRLFGELSFAQIGELFSKTESWARVTYYRAKTKIKEELP